MPNFEKFIRGHFSATEKEREENPDIDEKMEAANKAKNRIPGEQTRESLKKALERDLGDEEERPEEAKREVA